MKSKPILPLVLLLSFLSFAGYFALNRYSPQKNLPHKKAAATDDPMAIAAKTFLASLSEAQKSKAVFDFETAERQNFNFVPMARKGLIFNEMSREQRRLCLALVKTGLSEKGYAQSTGIMANEDILSDIEGRTRGNDYRNPGHYYIAVFNSPVAGGPWGWRFEGHHLSLNYTSVVGKLSVTPNFMGANPGRVPSGKHEGQRLLPEEEDLGRRLVQSLDEAQRRLAIISKTAYPEIITGTERVAAFGKKEGLPYAALLPEQQELLDLLLKVYLSRMKPEVAEAKWSAIQREGIDSLRFAWAGGLQPGEGHYYRIQGKSFVIEYDNTQNHANHIHTVWREFDGDFGRDLLREHYENPHRH